MSSRPHRHDGGAPEGAPKPGKKALSLSEAAAAHVRDYSLREGKTDPTIRIAAVRTHCMGGRGFSYSIDEDSVKPADTLIESDGLKLLVDQESLGYLRGARIDYEETFQGGGLVVHNPNAVGKCHCGRHDILDRGALAESGKC